MTLHLINFETTATKLYQRWNNAVLHFFVLLVWFELKQRINHEVVQRQTSLIWRLDRARHRFSGWQDEYYPPQQGRSCIVNAKSVCVCRVSKYYRKKKWIIKTKLNVWSRRKVSFGIIRLLSLFEIFLCVNSKCSNLYRNKIFCIVWVCLSEKRFILSMNIVWATNMYACFVVDITWRYFEIKIAYIFILLLSLAAVKQLRPFRPPLPPPPSPRFWTGFSNLRPIKERCPGGRLASSEVNLLFNLFFWKKKNNK